MDNFVLLEKINTIESRLSKCEKRIQIGEFNIQLDAILGERASKGKSKIINITFEFPYSKPPKLYTSINKLDAFVSSFIRYGVDVKEITNESAIIEVYTWHDSWITEINVNWLAIGD